MNEKIYLHSMSPSGFDYDSKGTLILFDKILSSNALLSANKRGVKSYNHFSGSDYISLSDYEKRFNTKKGNYNGYNVYARQEASIMFPKGKFDVIEPIILEHEITKYTNYRYILYILGMSNERYSDLNDEVQVKDMVSLEYMNGITLPCEYIINYWKPVKDNIIKLRDEVNKYRELLDKHNYIVPIHDIQTLDNLENDDNLERIVTNLKLTRGILKK